MSQAIQNISGEDAPAPRHGWAIMTALVLAELVSSFEASMIYAALKQFYTIFDDPVSIGWLLTGFMLIASGSAAICARLGDILGRKRMLLLCLGAAMCGSLISAASSQLIWIIVGRSIQGFAGAILPLCYGMVKEYFPNTRRATNVGIVAGTASGGAGIGLVVGGVLVDHGSWHYIFIASAVLAAIAAVAVALLVPRSRQFTQGRIDWIGGLLFVPGLTLLLYGLGVGEEHGWGSIEQLWPMGLGLAILAIWIGYEARSDEPLIDVRMLVDRQIGTTLLIIMLFAIGVMNLGQIIMVMLQQPVETGVGLGISATAAGVLHSPVSLIGVVAGPLCGWYAGRYNARGAMIIATICSAIAWIGLSVAHSSVWVVFLWLMINSFGLGGVMAAVPNLIIEAAPAGRTSEATGLAQIVRKIAGATGAQLIAISLATSTVRVGKGSFPDESAYTLTYAAIAALLVVAVVLSISLPRRSRPDQSHRAKTDDAVAGSAVPT